MADFASLGLWLWKSNSSGWVQISPMSANRVKEVKFVGGSQDYELLAEDNAGGLSWGNWNGSTFVWTLITNDDHRPEPWCETFDQMDRLGRRGSRNSLDDRGSQHIRLLGRQHSFALYQHLRLLHSNS